MRKLLSLFVFVITVYRAGAQDNYEIQVYGSETVAPKATMAELHSNYTFGGTKLTLNHVFPTHHMFHETVEITHGFTNWFEVGFYFFNAIGDDRRSNYVGSHIRPRVRVPATWNWPVGVSLSVEGGYQKPEYSEDDWSVEIRPIVDKTLGKLYLSFNPTVDKALHGLNSDQGLVFSPNAKVSYDVVKVLALGVEYYGSMGQLTHFSRYANQEHQLFIAGDLDFSKNWEVNFGFGWGLTKSTDNGIIKLLVGYRFL